MRHHDSDGLKATILQSTTAHEQASTHSDSVPDPTTVGGHRVLRKIGAGAMGVVYLARDEVLGRRVAVKVLARSLFKDPTHLSRFLGEARILARFNHPSIVTVYSAGDEHGEAYLAMEYVDGGTLRDRLVDVSLWTSEALRIGLDIARALQEAHSQNVVHGDLKPENVMIGRGGRPLVVDFGLSRMVSNAWEPPRAQEIQSDGADGSLQPAPQRGAVSTESLGIEADNDEAAQQLQLAEGSGSNTADRRYRRYLVGTPMYMSPERWRGDPIRTAADMWAFGVMMYEMLTGKHPYAGAADLQKLAHRIVMMSVLPRLETRGDVPPQLAEAIHGCFAKDPASRPKADDLVEELTQLVHSRAKGDRLQESPFRGLDAFSERHAQFFFGRTDEIESFVERIRVQPVLPVIGASGVGKSSFVQAGVIPRLRELGEWSIIRFRPGKDPFAALARAIGLPGMLTSSGPDIAERVPRASSEQTQTTQNELADELFARPKRLAALLAGQARAEGGSVLLLVDQMEEAVTMVADREVRDRFLEAVCGAADDRYEPVRVVCTARDDFLSRLAETPSMQRALERVMVLQLPGEKALTEIVTLPLVASGHKYDDDTLVPTMLAEVAGEAAALPLLQFTASLLWERRDSKAKCLRRSDYDAIGGVQGALASHADGVLKQLDVSDIQVVRGAMLRLVTPGGTRRTVERQELVETLGPRAAHVLDLLSDARLLAVRTVDAATYYELSHESLVQTWALLRGWLDEGRQEAAFIDELSQAATLWSQRGQRNTEVWTGEPLAEALRNIDRYGLNLASTASAFVDACRKAERIRLRRRRGLLAGAFALLALVAVVSTVKEREAALHRREAERQAVRAERQAVEARNMARIALAEKWQDNPTHRLVLLRDMEGETPPLGWEWKMRATLNEPVSLRVFTGHTKTVWFVAFSPDGRYIASASSDGTVRLWPANGRGEPRVLAGHASEVEAVAFSPDGRRVVSGSRDRTLRVWPLDRDANPTILRGHAGPVQSVAFSPDGQHIASASWDRTVRIWPASGDGAPRVLDGHTAEVYSVVYRPDARCLASASYDHTVRIWPLDTNGPPRVLAGHAEAVEAVAYSPDGRFVTSASKDKTLRVWAVDADGPPRLVNLLKGHTAGVKSTTYSPDGKRIASAGFDKTVRVWPSDSSGPPLLIKGHTAEVTGVAFSPDGQLIASGSVDNTVRLWRAAWTPEPQILPGHTAEVYSVAYSPDGQLIASGTADSTVRLWRADGKGSPRVIKVTGTEVYSVAFSPAGTEVGAGGADKTVRVWPVRGRGAKQVFRGHTDVVYAVVFSPDGRHVASGSADHTARIWPLAPDGQPRVLRGHGAEIYSVAYSPDGLHLVTASEDKTIRIWPVDGTGAPRVLEGHSAGVNSAAYSPDGLSIVSASWDKTVRVWQADDTASARILEGPAVATFSASFSPDGKLIVATGLDQTVLVWRMDESGTAPPSVLTSHTAHVPQAVFSPDGRRIVSGSWDTTVRRWRDWEPIALDDARVWQASSYCWPIDMYRQQLGFSEELANRQRDRCLARVAAHGL